MGRVEDFTDDSVSCDNPGCGKNLRVPNGVVADGWMRGELDGAPGQSYDVCGGNCALHVNKKLATDPTAEYSMTWWSSRGEAATTAVSNGKYSLKRKA